jgi:hypothetical protein
MAALKKSVKEEKPAKKASSTPAKPRTRKRA